MHKARAEQVQREVEALQRSLAARDSLVQQLKAARMADTPAREVGGAGWDGAGSRSQYVHVCVCVRVCPW